jgi:hypothetical protein
MKESGILFKIKRFIFERNEKRISLWHQGLFVLDEQYNYGSDDIHFH